MATAEGTYPKVGGDPVYNTEVNSLRLPVQQIYTTSGFDSSVVATGADDSVTGSVALNFISPGSLQGATYLKVNIIGYCLCSSAFPTTNIITGFEIRHSGGTFSLGGSEIVLHLLKNESIPIGRVGGISNVDWYHTLSANELASGLVVLPFSISTRSTSGTQIACSFVNKYTTLQTI